MIKPHGAEQLKPLYTPDPAAGEAARGLPAVTISSAAAANAVMLGGGYFTPLGGYMDVADALSVAEDMRTRDGVLWPVPVLNLLPDKAAVGNARRVALRDPNVTGEPILAVQEVRDVETLTDAQIQTITRHVYGTTDPAHPGVAAFHAQGRVAVSGPIEVLNYSYFATEFADTFRAATDIRADIEKLGWKKTVAFQTRNPMHRAHEELCHIAMRRLNCDGLVIHMLLGKLKPGDIPAAVRDRAIREMVKKRFAAGSAMVTGYGYDMLYAGPREAVLHAIFRQNMGATHFIIGRDHAGVGDYYGAFEAQEIFDAIPKDALEIEIFRADHTAWSKKLGKVVMMREARRMDPSHTEEDYILLSGTKMREMLSRGEAPPPELTRPEVARILIDYYAAG